MIVLAATATAATCPATGDVADPFRVPTSGERVHVVVELWASDAPEGWTEASLSVLDQRGLAGVVVLPAEATGPALSPLLQRIADSPHDLALVVARRAPRDASRPDPELRRVLRWFEGQVGPVRTVIAPIGDRNTEALLGQLGFRSLIDLEGAPSGSPRMAGHFEGQQRIDVVLPPGPYAGSCTDPRSAPFLPSAADRASAAIDAANGLPGQPVVRVALVGDGGAGSDATVLARWLDEVVLPSGAVVTTAEAARVAILEGYRRPDQISAPTSSGGRVVAVEELRAAAASLQGLDQLPRTLPGDLCLTELFVGLVTLEAGRVDDAVVRLRPATGPAALADSTLDGEVEVDRAALHEVSAALVAAWPTELPGALRVGTRLLTAGELLVALANSATTEGPVTTRPVSVPEPNQRGLGWGLATSAR